jgi:hypothetical protein
MKTYLFGVQEALNGKLGTPEPQTSGTTEHRVSSKRAAADIAGAKPLLRGPDRRLRATTNLCA